MNPKETAPEVIKHRVNNQKAAIIFVHGFKGNNAETWGEFPEFLLKHAPLNDWDMVSLGYSSKLAPDFSGVWSADAPIDRLATLLRTTVNVALPPYKAISFLAHSMGGLVVQRALVDDPGFAKKVTNLFLFGTPSDGLEKASPFGFFKRQLRDMKQGGAFITDLRQKWQIAFGAGTPFTFWAVAGERDEFVPSTSAWNGFPKEVQASIPGDHLSIVKPQKDDHLGLELVIKTLVGKAAPAGPWNSARVAVESRDFQTAISVLEPHAAELDEPGLVQLALAYDSVTPSRSNDAIKLLEDHGKKQTDAMGTLGGRLKRRWMVEHRQKDYDRALELYSSALQISQNNKDPDQIYYHAINVAFLKLAAGKKDDAREQAQKALEYAQQGDQAHWKLATRGEALLVLDNIEQAADAYSKALAAGASVREIESMYKQAMWIAAIKKSQAAVDALENVFRPKIHPAAAAASV